MHNVMAGYVDRGEIPGLVTLVSRRGEVQVGALGAKAIGGDLVRRDTIFRIASMTKAITAAAAMILVEECKLRLDEPVDRLLPELANRKVLKRLDDTVPAIRPITVSDLLTFRMGHGMVMGSPEKYPIVLATDELQIGTGPPSPATTPAPDEWIRRLGTLPLMHQPGERWMYNTGSEVLGVLIARASGQPFDKFLRERIFDPLGMHDTGFSVPAAKIGRLATSYWTNFATGKLDPARDYYVRVTTRTRPLGGSLLGLTKTVALEGARSGITVNAVAPGFTMTEMVAALPPAAIEAARNRTPEQRLAQPEEIARVVRFLIDEQSAFVTGATYDINGGMFM